MRGGDCRRLDGLPVVLRAGQTRRGFVAVAAVLRRRRVSVEKTPPAGGTRVNVKLSERIKMRDPLTGELREYHSLDEVPAEYREKIRQAREAALSGQGGNVISVTDATGKVQTYHSVEEMPPELRALYEKARSEGLVK